MTYANIKLQQHTAYDRQGNSRKQEKPVIHPFMQPFVEALALKYPQWEFVECDARSKWTATEQYYEADGFKIMERREELGIIRVDHYCRAGKRYWVENFRINERRERGSGYKTKHMELAIKHVSKYFGTRNHAELLAAAATNAAHVKAGILNDLHGVFMMSVRNIEDHALQFMRENRYDEFIEWTKQKGYWRTEVDTHPEAYRNFDEARKINVLFKEGKLWLVHIVNSDYIVKQGGTVSVLESDKLPNIVRRNLGMLKLVKDKELISNVGIRVDESTYYVVGEQE